MIVVVTADPSGLSISDSRHDVPREAREAMALERLVPMAAGAHPVNLFQRVFMTLSSCCAPRQNGAT